MIYGDNDHGIPPEMYRGQEAPVRGRLRVDVHPRLRAFLQVEAPAAFAERVVGFLTSG